MLLVQSATHLLKSSAVRVRTYRPDLTNAALGLQLWLPGGGQVHVHAQVHPSVVVEAGAVVQEGSTIGKGSRIGSASVIGPSVSLGENVLVGFQVRQVFLGS